MITKGINELRLNTATMMVIVQEWLSRSVMSETPVVLGFEQVTHLNSPTFLVRIGAPQETPK